MRAPLLLLAAAVAGGDAATYNVCTNFRPRLRSATMCLYNNTDTCAGDESSKRAVARLPAAYIARFKITLLAGECIRVGADVTQGIAVVRDAFVGNPFNYYLEDCDAENLLQARSTENTVESFCGKNCFDVTDNENPVVHSGTITDCVVEPVTQTAGPGVSVVDAPQDSDWNHWYTVAIAGGSITVLAGVAYASSGMTVNCDKAAKFIGFEGHETAAKVEEMNLL